MILMSTQNHGETIRLIDNWFLVINLASPHDVAYPTGFKWSSLHHIYHAQGFTCSLHSISFFDPLVCLAKYIIPGIEVYLIISTGSH